MKQAVYEKPKMKKVILRNNRAVADGNCWSLQANATQREWFYDYNEGPGYIQFKLEHDNCSGNGKIIEVQYLPKTVGQTPEAVEAVNTINSLLKTTIKDEFTGWGITDDPSQVS